MNLKPLLLIVIVTLLTSFGQFFLKQGADLLPMFLTWQLALGIVLYLIAAGIFLNALRESNVSLLVPILATSFIWVSLLGVFLLGESLTIINWVGVATIVLGVSIVGVGGQHD